MYIWRFTTMNLQELLRRLRAGETRAAISRATTGWPGRIAAPQPPKNRA